MDDFGVKYFNKDDSDHLIESLKKHYAISKYWVVHNYLGLTIYWKYNKKYVDISIPEYMKKYLDQLQHPKPKVPQYAPHRWTVPAYVKRPQRATDSDEKNILDNKSTNIIKSIVGTMLYYARSFDPKMLRVINKISRVRSKPTNFTKEKANILPDYAEKYPSVVICYKSSNMVLHVNSDASYLTMPEARSCYAGHFYLSYGTSPRPIKPTPRINGPIHTECKTIYNVLSSAAEAETCGTFNNRKKAIGMRPALITLDHKQLTTPLKTDNSIT